MKTVEKAFLECIEVAMSGRQSLSRSLTSDEWNAVVAMAAKQTLLGVCFEAVQHLPAEQRPERPLYKSWLSRTVNVQIEAEHHKEVLESLVSFLKEKSIPAIFMKGLVCASRYAVPWTRQCGDIDFVVKEEDYAGVMSALEEISSVNHSLVHEHHGMAKMQGVPIEPHYKIHNYQNPRHDAIMRGWQEELFSQPECYAGVGGLQVRKFPDEFEGMFLVSHMVNHVYEEGLGLRQVMDFAWWLRSFRGDASEYHDYLRRMNMTRAARIFSLVCEEYFCVDPSIMSYKYSTRERAFAGELMEDMLEVGNFAKGASKRPSAGLESYAWVTRRAIRLGWLCPSEASWWPLAKLARFFWKKTK